MRTTTTTTTATTATAAAAMDFLYREENHLLDTSDLKAFLQLDDSPCCWGVMPPRAKLGHNKKQLTNANFGGINRHVIFVHLSLGFLTTSLSHGPQDVKGTLEIRNHHLLPMSQKHDKKIRTPSEKKVAKKGILLCDLHEH